MPRLIKKDSTDVTDYVFIVDSTAFTPETTITITDLDLQYVRNGAAPSAKVDATALAAVDSAHGDNKMIEIDATDQPGLYRVDWPDAAFATGVSQVICTVKGTGFHPVHIEYQLVDFDPDDATRLGLIALSGYEHNSIWIDTVNGSAGTVDYVNGTVDNPVNSIADANTLAASLGISRFEIASNSSITFAAAQTNQIFHGDKWTLALGGQNVAGSSFIGAAVSGVMAGTGVLQYFIDCVINATSIIKGTVFKRCLIASTITVVEAGEHLFTQCSSSVAGAGTPTFDFGSALNSSNLSVRNHSGGWTIENMGAGTGTYNASFEGNGQIIWAASCSATSNASIRGHWKITDNAGGAVTETLDDIISDLNAVKAVTDQQGAAIIEGTVDTVVNSHSPTTTQFQADDITEATPDHYNGRLVLFTSGVLNGQMTVIDDYVLVGGIGQFTVTAMTEPPANNDTFLIL